MFYPVILPTSPIEADLTANNAKVKTHAVEQRIDAVHHDIERLLMITEALWTLLKKEHGYKDADLVRLVGEIDLRDGSLDGRVAANRHRIVPTVIVPCSRAGRCASIAARP